MEQKFIKTINSRFAFPYRMILPFLDPRRFVTSFPQYVRFLAQFFRYRAMDRSEKILIRDMFPALHDRVAQQPFDAHYFYQNIWAFQEIAKTRIGRHVDIGSSIALVGLLTAITDVTYVDIRRLDTCLANLEFRKGTILDIPFDNNSVESLSCLHVAEHVGLGRYGDTLDPRGTEKSCLELKRVLSRSGHLYFSLPLGKPRVCFNAHRIHSVSQILEYFSGLKLVRLSAIDDRKMYHSDVDVHFFDSAEYSCGLFHFTNVQYD